MTYQCHITEKMCNNKIKSKVSLIRGTQDKFKIDIISECQSAKKFAEIIGKLEWKKRDLYKLTQKDIWDISKISGLRSFCPLLPSILNCVWIELGFISESLAKKAVLRAYFKKNGGLKLIFDSNLCGHLSTFKKKDLEGIVLNSSCKKAKSIIDKIAIKEKLDITEDEFMHLNELTPTCYLPSFTLFLLMGDIDKFLIKSSEIEEELICEIYFLEI